MDILTVLGILLALGAILGGQVLEGGHIGSILQFTAFLIVIGGTLGAVCVQFPLAVVKKSLALLKLAFFNPPLDLKSTSDKIVALATVSRKQGLLALEGELKSLTDPFLKKGIRLLVDGTEGPMLRAILETEMDHEEANQMAAAKFYEAAGGYAPTIGIIGAVLGLIHVMENLTDPSKLGAGIAVAFVATIYGVGSANIIFLPLANKLKYKIKQGTQRQQMLLDGILAIAAGDNPRMIQEKLESYLPHHQRAKTE